MPASPVRLLAAAALLCAAVPVSVSAAPLCDPGALLPSGWRRIAAPHFSAGEQKITTYAVASDASKTMLVTNGVTIARSGDGGCSWSTVLTVPATPTATFPFSRETATLVGLVSAKQRAYAVLSDATGPRVVVSKDDGKSWTNATMPAVDALTLGRTTRVVADLDGTTAYALAKVAGGAFGLGGDVLYVTKDGGASWTPQPITVASSGSITDVVDVGVDPLVGSDVFVGTSYGILQSNDHGESWTADGPDTGARVGSLTVTHRPGRARQVALTDEIETVVHLRTSTGEWTTVNTPGVATSIVGGRTTRQAAISTAAGVYELDYGALRWKPVHGRAPALSQLTTDFTEVPSFYACECGSATSAIWARAPRAADDGPEPPTRGDERDDDGYPGFYGCAPDRKQLDEPKPFAPSAVTQPAEVSLALGKSVTLPVNVRVRPRLLDVYYLIDTGPRSYYFGCAAKQGSVWAAAELSRTRNVRAGAGEYRDFLNPTPNAIYLNLPTNCVIGTKVADFTYRRRVRVGAVDQVFRNAVGAIDGGGCTADHAGLTALYQTATGEGTDAMPGASPYDIRPGQDAGFAPDAFKVVVHVAGGYFSEPSDTYPGNSFDEAIGALKKHGIKQVGIHVPYDQKKHHTGDPVHDETGANDLRRVARGTGTLSTKPIDCGEDIVTNVRVGDPLVCSFVDTTAQPKVPPMGKQIVELVTALRDLQPMRVALLSGDAKLATSAYGVRDHLLAHTMTTSVTVTCKPSDSGTVKRIEVGGQVGSSVVATGETLVRCGQLPVLRRRPPDHFDLVPPLPQGAAVAISNTLPNLQPQTQPASQSQTNPQQLTQLAGAAAPQNQEAPRLAYVEANTATEPVGEELAMSALPPTREEDVPIWAFASAVAMTTVAAGFALRRRTSHAVARARR